MVFWIQNSDFSSRTASLYGSRHSPVVLWMQNSVINTRGTSLNRSQPSSVVFACKTAPFGTELQVSIGPILRLLICEGNTARLDLERRFSISPSPHL